MDTQGKRQQYVLGRKADRLAIFKATYMLGFLISLPFRNGGHFVGIFSIYGRRARSIVYRTTIIIV